MLMGISGIYAGTAQITSGQSSTNGVDIKIQTFKLNSENVEEKYEESTKVVMPAEVISFIPKIENLGAKCYVRAKIFYINEDVDAETYITGISSEWEKHGEYYYYKNALNSEEIVKLFDTIKIPQNIGEITSSKKIKLEITAEAVQEKNFEPDYTKEDPWQGIVPTQSVNTEYNIDTNIDKNITINYENGTGSDIEVSDEFLENMKDIMPGDSYSSSIKIKNTNKKNAKYYLKLDLDGLNEIEIGLLEEIDLIITNKQGKVIYSGKLRNVENVLLGKYDIGEEDEFDLKMSVPKDLANKYAGIYPKLNWTFSVDYDKDTTKENNDNQNKSNPQTGDKINVSITIFLISSMGLLVVMLLDYKEKRNIE